MENEVFLKELLDAVTVSGSISLGSRVIRKEMEACADEVITDILDDTIAVLNPQAEKKILVTAHLDEIGLVITGADEDGYLYAIDSRPHRYLLFRQRAFYYLLPHELSLTGNPFVRPFRIWHISSPSFHYLLHREDRRIQSGFSIRLSALPSADNIYVLYVSSLAIARILL